MDLQPVIDEVAAVMYVCSYVTKGEKAMGETLKNVAKECRNDDIHTQMNKIRKEFVGKRVFASPESAMRILSMWLMKKSRKVTSVNTDTAEQCVRLPKSQSRLAQMDDDDDDDVFATSLIDRYAARPQSLNNMCLATFAVNYEVHSTNMSMNTTDFDSDIEQSENLNTGQHKHSDINIQKITLRDGLGSMRKRKQESVLRTARYKVHNNPEKYYHSKLLLYYPWTNEHELLTGFNSYQESYVAKQHIIHPNAQHFNDDCQLFDLSPEDIENEIPQSIWDLTAPSIAQDDANTTNEGYNTIQKLTEEQVNDTDRALDANSQDKQHHQLAQLYEKAARHHDMTFHEYCAQIQSLNTEQHHIVMFNRVWCKSYIHAMRNKEKLQGYRIFLSGPGGTGKTHVLKLIQRDIYHLLHTTVNADPDQPLVLMTAPTGTAAFQIGGSTIDSALLTYDSSRNKPTWEKKTIMQLKLEHLILFVNDEVSMVGYKKFQTMNQTMCTIKGTTDADWGNICVLAVGDLYQLPPVGQCPIYMPPNTINTLNDFTPNGWETMKLHELTQTM